MPTANGNAARTSITGPIVHRHSVESSTLVGRAHRCLRAGWQPGLLPDEVDRCGAQVVRRRRVPSGDFIEGELNQLPVADRSVDIVTCALALSHLAELGPAMAEFARVLRPDGHLIISDVHIELILRGSVVPALGPHGEPGLVPTFRHSTGDFLRAALSAGLVVRRYDEPALDDETTDEYAVPEPGQMDPGQWGDWPWSLMWLIPDVVRALHDPILVLWHLQTADQM